MSRPLILVPSYNVSYNSMNDLISSLRVQSNQDFKVVFAIDNCQKSLVHIEKCIQKHNPEFEYVIKYSSRRRFALKNIVATLLSSDCAIASWVGILDGDDHLLTSEVIDLFNREYRNGAEVVWSSFLWDGHSCNISSDLPFNCNPYKHPWVSSHFKTFKYDTFLSIPLANYLDNHGNFFRRCYDHALMLPLLWHCTVNRKPTKHIPKPLYYYNNTYSSIPTIEHSQGAQEGQIAQYIRSRGFVS